MHVPGLKLSGVRSYQGTSRSRLLLPKEEKDRSDTRLKDTSEPKKKDTSEPKKKDRSDRAPTDQNPYSCNFVLDKSSHALKTKTT